jgi:coproporphyrinogen III oxidase-like Fe-S oxidoreductase
MIPIISSTDADAAKAASPRDVQHYMRPGTLQLAALPPLALYIHLPWCLKKCPYCDFKSHEMRAADLPDRLGAHCSQHLHWWRHAEFVFARRD